MARASLFLSVSLLVTTLGMAAQDGARGKTTPTSNAQISQPSQASANAAQQSAEGPATGDRTKRIQGSDQGSENLVQNRAPLPQTSTILPLLGFIGLGSLLAGLFARR